MTTHVLDTAKLMDDVDRARRAGTPSAIPYRQIARDIGAGPSIFTRLRAGYRVDADTLCALLLWLDPDVRLSEYALPAVVTKRRAVS